MVGVTTPMHRSGVADEHYAGPTQSAIVQTRSSGGPGKADVLRVSATHSLRRLMNQWPNHCALFSFTEMPHSQPRQSDSHSIDTTTELLHRVFRLQPKGLPRAATVAIRLLLLHPIGVRRLSCGPTATYPRPHGRGQRLGKEVKVSHAAALCPF
jgi:hypothetical protein